MLKALLTQCDYSLEINSRVMSHGFEEKFLSHVSYFLHQVLDIEFHNVKALYRRAQSYIETADYISADADIKQALEADPQNRYMINLNPQTMGTT